MHEEVFNILAVKEMQIKATLNSNSPQSRWLSSRKETTTNAGDGGKGAYILLTGM
jgi:hypothetical protein